ncbi:hypothetical protein [Geofilum rhodophaeum]|uniref:hypothetical protein n=1 Tax=Geofilum rhodophaeum TaxID=1965019 RepID=UPI000B5291F0|nr:hypothetical protein [Geofilum rhodophaeum]
MKDTSISEREVKSLQKELKKKLQRATSLAFDRVLKNKGPVSIEITSYGAGACINSIGGVDATHPYWAIRFNPWPHLHQHSDGDEIRKFYENQIKIVNHWISLLK